MAAGTSPIFQPPNCWGLPAQDSPTNKLLYAKEIPEYRKIVQRYYKQIQDMTPLSEQEMNAHLAEESRVGGLWGLGPERITVSLALGSGPDQHPLGGGRRTVRILVQPLFPPFACTFIAVCFLKSKDGVDCAPEDV